MLLLLRKAEGSAAGLMAVWLGIRSIARGLVTGGRPQVHSIEVQFGRASRGTGEPPTRPMQAAALMAG